MFYSSCDKRDRELKSLLPENSVSYTLETRNCTFSNFSMLGHVVTELEFLFIVMLSEIGFKGECKTFSAPSEGQLHDNESFH